MGQTQFRRGEITETATGKMTDLIGINKLDAKASKNLGTVKVAMSKGFRFGARSSAAVALA